MLSTGLRLDTPSSLILQTMVILHPNKTRESLSLHVWLARCDILFFFPSHSTIWQKAIELVADLFSRKDHDEYVLHTVTKIGCSGVL